MFKVVVLLAILISIPAFAQEPAVSALTFQAWEEQQTLEAQNQALRISARISQLKAGKPVTSGALNSSKLPSAKIKKSEDSVAVAERDLRRAQDSLQSAGTLSLEDYVTIYLPTLQDQPEALHGLALKLSKEELAEIFKLLVVRSSQPTDTRRNTALTAESRSITSRAKPL